LGISALYALSPIEQELCHCLGAGFVWKNQGIFTLPITVGLKDVVGETVRGEISGKEG
jgi:hypothetical protein